MLQKLLSILSLGLLPKKRASAEVNDDEQTNEDSDGLFRKGNNAKRARLDSYSNITLQDLPNELLECILVKAVAMEVKDLKLIKSVWKDKVDLVINRLKSVSSHWTSILSTDVFRNKVDRLLDGTAQETIRLEVLNESSTRLESVAFITSLKDEIFMLERRDQCVVIKVYSRDNMAKMTGVVAIQTEHGLKCMTACNVSNCIYVGLRNGDNTLSVLRISKDGENQFNVSPWINDHKLKVYMMGVCTNGNLLLLSLLNGTFPNPGLLSMYDVNGSLLHEIILPPDIGVFRCKTALQKSNGNLILFHVSGESQRTNLMEIDASGSIVRRYESSCCDSSCANFADIHGRIVITDQSGGEMELLDPEFNLIGIYRFRQDEGKEPFVHGVHFASERNEIVRTLVYYCPVKYNVMYHAVTTFRFTEE